jgi:hypothetical protein
MDNVIVPSAAVEVVTLVAPAIETVIVFDTGDGVGLYEIG